MSSRISVRRLLTFFACLTAFLAGPISSQESLSSRDKAASAFSTCSAFFQVSSTLLEVEGMSGKSEDFEKVSKTAYHYARIMTSKETATKYVQRALSRMTSTIKSDDPNRLGQLQNEYLKPCMQLMEEANEHNGLLTD